MKTIIMLGIIPLFLLVTPALANTPVGTWTYYNSTSGESGQITMTTANSDHIEFKDIHGNTISLRGGNMTGMRMGASAMNDTQRYNSGFAQGLAGMKMKGHHTEAFLNGYNDGKLQREDKIAQQNPAKYGYSNAQKI